MLTLNLIPPQVKQDVQTSTLYRHWLRALVVVFIGGCIATGGITVAWKLLVGHAQATHTGLVSLQESQKDNSGSDLSTTTGSLNTTIKILSSALATPRSWSRDISVVLAAVPSGAAVSELSFSSPGKFRLVGVADSRQTFVTLDQNLKSNSRLQQVTTTSTASKRTAVPFDYSGTVIAEGVNP